MPKAAIKRRCRRWGERSGRDSDGMTEVATDQLAGAERRIANGVAYLVARLKWSPLGNASVDETCDRLTASRLDLGSVLERSSRAVRRRDASKGQRNGRRCIREITEVRLPALWSKYSNDVGYCSLSQPRWSSGIMIRKSAHNPAHVRHHLQHFFLSSEERRRLRN